jgi:hypothetical protein
VIAPGTADEGLGRIEPAFEIKGADQRLDRVAQHIVALHGAIVARLLAELEMGGDSDVAADIGAGLAADDRVQAPRQIALRLVGEDLVEPRAGDEAEHPVAQEFQPFIMVRAIAAMGQRALEQGEVAGLVAERFDDPGAKGGFMHRRRP